MAGERYNKLFRVNDANQIEMIKPIKLLDTVWEDLRSPATSINPPGLVGDPDWDNTNGGWLFDPSGIEQLWIIVEMPHSWKLESTIRPHIHWMPTTTNTGSVLWRMEYKWTNYLGTEAMSFTTVDILHPADGTALKYQIAKFSDVSGTGKLLSSLMSIKLSRVATDASDTYTGDALLKEFDIHYQIDTPGGSYDEYNKA